MNLQVKHLAPTVEISLGKFCCGLAAAVDVHLSETQGSPDVVVGVGTLTSCSVVWWAIDK